MDAYHKVLAKLFEVTGGKETEKVDFKELVKSTGFLPSYADIFQQMSRQGWIAETSRADVVKITHWGVKEARKTAGVDGSNQTAKREINRLVADARELLIFLEELSEEPTLANQEKAERKADALASDVRSVKGSL